MTKRSRQGLAISLAAAVLPSTAAAARRDRAERVTAPASFVRVIQQSGRVEVDLDEAKPSETADFVLSGVVAVADAAQSASVRVSAGEGTSVAASAGAEPAVQKTWGAKRAADALSRTGIE